MMVGPCRATLEIATAGRRRRGATGLDLDRRRGAAGRRRPTTTGGGIDRGRRTTAGARRRGPTAGASETDTAEAPLRVLSKSGLSSPGPVSSPRES